MHLAKPVPDVGLFTADPQSMAEFWRETVGLQEEAMLKLGGGIHQRRFTAGASVIKCNHALRPLIREVGGITGIQISTPCETATTLRDPEGGLIHLTPSEDGVTRLAGICMEVADVLRSQAFWAGVMELPLHHDGCMCGSTRIEFRQARYPPKFLGWQALGWSYLTLQVRDCAAEHAAALSRGAVECEPPRRMGEHAVISFLRDPDGNIIEFSQKAALVGPIPSP